MDQDLYYKIRKQDRQQKNLLLQQYFPYLYYVGQQNKIFNLTNIFQWIFEGTITAVVIFYLAKESMNPNVINQFSNDLDI